MQFILYANLNKMPESADGNYLPLVALKHWGLGVAAALVESTRRCTRAGPHMKNGPIRPMTAAIEAQEFA
jgi:hypothetical protein